MLPFVPSLPALSEVEGSKGWLESLLRKSCTHFLCLRIGHEQGAQTMSYPTHTIGLIVASGAVSGILYWLFAQAALRRLTLSGKRVWQIGITVFLVAAYLLALSFSLTQRYTVNSANSAGLIPLLIGIMIGSNVLLWIGTRGYRQMVDAIPLHWLISSHVLRVIPGIAFLALHDMGLLPPDTALQAGYGDLLSGILALAVAYLVYRRSAPARGAAFAWSIFAVLDLVNALYLGQTTIPAWSLKLSSTGQSIDFINLFVMLPTYMVPLFLVSHLWIFRKLGSRKVEATKTREVSAPA
jgi:hypothetical protein